VRAAKRRVDHWQVKPFRKVAVAALVRDAIGLWLLSSATGTASDREPPFAPRWRTYSASSSRHSFALQDK
jgi:hypothetical protein